MNGNVGVLAYAGGGFLIVVYAWGRSNVRPGRLGALLLVYLALGGPIFAHAASTMHQPTSGLMAAGKIAHLQLVTIGMTVWQMQRQAYFRRATDDPPGFFASFANSIMAATIAVSMCLVFHAGDADPLAGTGRDLRVILVSFPLCAAVACFRDKWAGDTTRPGWLRGAETAGGATVMSLAIALLFLGGLFPFATNLLQGWRLAVLIALTSGIALAIGGCVRHERAVEDGAGNVRERFALDG